MKRTIKPSISKLITIFIFINVILLFLSLIGNNYTSFYSSSLFFNMLLLIWYLSKKRITMIELGDSSLKIRLYQPLLKYRDIEFNIHELSFKTETKVGARGIKNTQYLIIDSNGNKYDLSSSFNIWNNQDIQFLSENLS